MIHPSSPIERHGQKSVGMDAVGARVRVDEVMVPGTAEAGAHYLVMTAAQGLGTKACAGTSERGVEGSCAGRSKR